MVQANNKPREWTDDEFSFLKENIGLLTFTDIAKRLGKTTRIVSYMAEKFGLYSPKKHSSKIWTEDDDLFLREKYGKITYEEMAEYFNVSKNEVMTRCRNKLQITQNGKGSNNIFPHTHKKFIEMTNEKRNIFDENFFGIPNLINSYWAGFLAADGNIRTNKKSLSLQISDKDFEHIKCFQIL